MPWRVRRRSSRRRIRLIQTSMKATYLRAFPDIAEAVRRGALTSGLEHFRKAGRAEMRLEKAEYRALLASHAGPAAPQISVDTLTISASGSTLMTGWSNDRLDHLRRDPISRPSAANTAQLDRLSQTGSR